MSLQCTIVNVAAVSFTNAGAGTNIALVKYWGKRPGAAPELKKEQEILQRCRTRLEEGPKELAWYLKKHPDDSIGYFDQAQF